MASLPGQCVSGESLEGVHRLKKAGNHWSHAFWGKEKVWKGSYTVEYLIILNSSSGNNAKVLFFFKLGLKESRGTAQASIK